MLNKHTHKKNYLKKNCLDKYFLLCDESSKDPGKAFYSIVARASETIVEARPPEAGISRNIVFRLCK